MLGINKSAENILLLYLAHFARYALPLATIPYLARVLGVESWGVLSFLLAYSNIANLFIEYGFGLSATKDVAQNRNDSNILAKILGEVLGAQVVLSIMVAVISFVVIGFTDGFQASEFLLTLALSYAIAQAFNLFWFFRGIEKMRIVASLDILSKLLATVFIFAIVDHQDDLWLVMTAYTMSSAIVAALSFVFVHKVVRCIKVPDFFTIIATLKAGFHFFIVRGGAMLFSAGNIIVLGSFTSPLLVGYFTGAERIVTVVRNTLTPAVDAFYPRMNYIVKSNFNHAHKVIIKLFWCMLGLGIFLSSATFLFAEYLVLIILGSEFEQAISILRILSFLPIIVAVNHVLGSQWMVPLGLSKIFSMLAVTCGAISVLATVLVLLLVPSDNSYILHTVAVVIVICQFLLTLMYFVVLTFKGLNPLSQKLY